MRCISVEFLRLRRCDDSWRVRRSTNGAASSSFSSCVARGRRRALGGGARLRAEPACRIGQRQYSGDIGRLLRLGREWYRQRQFWTAKRNSRRVYSKSTSDKNVKICYDEVYAGELPGTELVVSPILGSGGEGGGVGVSERRADVVSSTELMSIATAEENPLLENMVEMTLSGTAVSNNVQSPRISMSGSIGVIDVEGSQTTLPMPKIKEDRRSRQGVEAVPSKTIGDAAIMMQVLTFAAGAIADPLMSMVDMAYVGRIGVLELAAMGPNGTIFNIGAYLATGTLLNATTTYMAQAMGSKEKADRCRALQITLWTTTIIGTTLAALLLANPTFWLSLAGCDESIMALAKDYFCIRAVALPMTFITLVMQGVYSAALDVATPFKVTLATALLNIFLDGYFIQNLGMGVAGAAAATAISQVLAAISLIVLMVSKHKERFGIKSFASVFALPRPRACLEFLSLCGVVFFRTINIVVAWALAGGSAARLGVVSTAVYNVTYNMQMWMVYAIAAFTTVGTAVVSHVHHREGRNAAVNLSLRLCFYSVVIAILFGASTWFLKDMLPLVFTQDPSVLAGVQETMTPLCIMLAWSWYKSLEGCLMGLNDGGFVAMTFIPAMIFTVGHNVLARLNESLNVNSIWWSLCGYYAILCVLMTGRTIFFKLKCLGTNTSDSPMFAKTA